jgi:SAM-dependent methyltransferase
MKAAVYHSGRHLSPSELMDRRQACPVCLSEAARRAVFRVQLDPVVDMLRCTACHVSSASMMPTAATLDAYYRDYYVDQESSFTFGGASRFARHLLAPMIELPATVRILDYGGGDGSLALAAARILVGEQTRAVEVLVVDYARPQQSDDPRIAIGHADVDQAIEGTWDIVIASAILEHVPDVNPVFRKVLGAIAPGGYLYARTPYVLPFARLIPRLDLTFPAHVHDMGSSFWNRVVEVFGFDGRYVTSGPSIVETQLRAKPLRTIAAHVLKLPGRLEGLVSTASRRDRIWNLVGGWEVVLQKARGAGRP